MTLVLYIALCAALGVGLPRLLVPRLPGSWRVLWSSAVTLAAGFGLVWAAAQGVALLDAGDFKLEFERAVNAWKLLIFLAPAAGLHFNRQRAASGGD